MFNLKREINQSAQWKKLEKLAKKMRKVEMREMFAKDNKRAEKYSLNLENMLVDFSKNRIDDKVFKALISLAKKAKVQSKIAEMFEGEKINITENRAVLHIALRNRDNTPIYVDGENVMPEINKVLSKIKDFSEAVRLGKFVGHTGKKLTNIVNIGIGGSDLGPKMAVEALKKYMPKEMNCYFISNIDGTACAEVLNKVDPETTLFIVCSKTFTTIETLTNAKTCRKWLVDALGEHATSKHFVAVSTNAKEVEKFGIDVENMFEFWDFVGGRYSMWSAIGLIVAIAVGYDNFEKMLSGANAMDKHFRTAELDKNIPVVLAMLSIWYNNFFNIRNHVVVPYDQYLTYLPAYLQQLIMESNGKYVDLNNKFIKYQTSPVIFGGAGTDVQHSFFQMLHQGTSFIPCDFIIPAISHNEIGEHHEILLANILAQSEALMMGKTTKEAMEELKAKGLSADEVNKLKKYKTFKGNRPSNTIIFKKIDPFALGMLVAMYEHKTYVEGVVWNIASFDQMGVELGKQLALRILPELQGNKDGVKHDCSTTALINLIKGFRK
ncbi:MAG: glucose-6-phosphate isomerase [Alphaproteobacteria bacterium]|nr:glucose-6-phosphate isomerase [Alphaproteobacteria bacterium]